MGVSGELRYFGPALSSVERVRPVKAMTLPASLLIGNMTRLRNLEYIAEIAASGFWLRASDLGPSTSDLGPWTSDLGEPSRCSPAPSGLSGALSCRATSPLSFRAERGICCC